MDIDADKRKEPPRPLTVVEEIVLEVVAIGLFLLVVTAMAPWYLAKWLYDNKLTKPDPAQCPVKKNP